MKEKSAIIVLLLLTLTLTSCIHDSRNLEDCLNRMRIELRWIETQPLAEDESVHIDIDPVSPNMEEREILSDVYGVDVDLMEGDYHLVGFEDHQNATIDCDNHIISIETTADGMAVEPGIFSAGIATADVELTDGYIIIPLPMYRQVRPLIVRVNFVGAGIGLLQGIDGLLTGIALERLLTDGFPPVNRLNRPPAIRNGQIDYSFAPVEIGGEGIWFQGRRNLLGIDGNVTQNLTLDITYQDSPLPTRATTQLSFDITEQMTEFHTKDVNQPWYVILTINLGVSLEAEIVDWLVGPESWFVAQ